MTADATLNRMPVLPRTVRASSISSATTRRYTVLLLVSLVVIGYRAHRLTSRRRDDRSMLTAQYAPRRRKVMTRYRYQSTIRPRITSETGFR